MRLLGAAIVLLGAAGVARSLPAQKPPPRDSVLLAARDIMKAARYTTLVTLGPDGHPQARIVDPFVPEKDLTIWIATTARSRKVREIRQDRRVTLLYFNPGGLEYVTVVGRAEIVTAAADKARLWKEEWSAFYQDKNRGPDYTLIRVRPSRLEVVSPRHRLTNDPDTWRPVLLKLP